MDNTESALKAIGMFSVLKLPEFQALVADTHRIEIPAGGMIATEGEEGDACYLVLDGVVQIFTSTVNCSEIVLAKIGKGRLIAHLCRVI